MYTKEEMHEALVKAYNKKGSYITTVEAGKALGCCATSFHKYMKKVDGYEDCPDVFRFIQKPIRVFEQINEEAAYWLGYLMADGCIAEKKPHTENGQTTLTLMLECKTEDKEILEKFCDFIGVRKDRLTSGHQGKSVALSIAANNFTTDFSDFGLVPHKSHIENHLPNFVYGNKNLFFQYFRGLVDGDGTIHTSYGSPGISLVGNSLSMMQEIKNQLEKYIPEPSSIWILEKTVDQQKGKNATQSLYTIKMGSGIKDHSNLSYVYNQFYLNQKIILTRKEQALKSLL